MGDKYNVTDNSSTYVVTDNNSAYAVTELACVYASDYGFLPTATAAENVAAFNSIGGGKVVIINVPGIYEINGTIFLESNTTYNFISNITIKKDISGGDFCHVFANSGVQTETSNSNIYFYGNNLTIDINGSSNSNGIILSTRANIQFFRVSNFIIDGIYTYNEAATTQYFFALSDCHDGEISNFNITSVKDGIDFIGNCYNMYIHDIINQTSDDAFFIGVGYGIATPVVGDCYNFLFERITLNAHPVPAGNGWNLWAGSWTDWLNGRTYTWNEMCINGGRIYVNITEGNTVASVAPTHTSGDITGVDGITWRYVQDGTTNYSSVYDITIKDVTINTNRYLTTFSNSVVTTGTEGISIIDEVSFENITFYADYDKWAFAHFAQVGTVTLTNINLTTNSTPATGGLMFSQLKDGPGTFEHLIIDNCTIDVTDGKFINFIRDSDYTFDKITITDSDITYTSATNVLFLASDGVLDKEDMNISGTKFTGLYILYQPLYDDSSVNIAITMTDCEFVAPFSYILNNNYKDHQITYVSTGTTYVNPEAYLFRNNNVAATMSVDLSLSVGSVDAGKFSSGTVTIIREDVT